MDRSDANRFLPAVVPTIAGLRAALQVYEQSSNGGWFKIMWFIWELMPYLVCLFCPIAIYLARQSEREKDNEDKDRAP